jgi:hypothetical protein
MAALSNSAPPLTDPRSGRVPQPMAAAAHPRQTACLLLLRNDYLLCQSAGSLVMAEAKQRLHHTDRVLMMGTIISAKS